MLENWFLVLTNTSLISSSKILEQLVFSVLEHQIHNFFVSSASIYKMFMFSPILHLQG